MFTSLVNLEHLIPNDMVMEVLHRLPIKSLMRFKCVSKLWNSIISEAHPSNSDGLLVTFTDIDATSQPGQPVERFLRLLSDRTLHHQASVLLTEYSITQTINGRIISFSCVIFSPMKF
ncbi:putative F-box protein [Abeliophyllum distichum]|uniref:F-box protein n=1 Tax=Abeliophyllum distichum TaxID=126358 RepID=A0ABD1S0U0_9LAMI